MFRIFHGPVFAAADEGTAAAAANAGATQTAAAATQTAAAATTAATNAATTTTAAWWQGSDYSAEEQQWLAARGLADDDAAKVMPKLVKGHRAAEQRIGKGLDAIIDRPAKDQRLSDWSRANAAALGLPEKEDGYTVTPPDFWPKELAWDTDLEAKARKVAFDSGVSPEAHQAYVNLFAEKMTALETLSKTQAEAANQQMLADLTREYGQQTDAVITKARQGAQLIAEKAGLSTEALNAVGATLSAKTGDAGVIRFMAAIADMMGEDSAVGLHKGGGLTMTPADARAELARFEATDGEYGKALASGSAAQVTALRGRREQLAKIASGGRG
jgi:hypothetical protein